MVTATPAAFPDLYWALRGGGGNFGIVTNFKLDAFPLGQMWGGQRIFTENNFNSVLDALYNFAVTGSSKDTDAAEIVVRILYFRCVHRRGSNHTQSFGFTPSIGKIAIVQTHYAQPVADPPVFDEIRALSPVMDDTAFGTLANMTMKMNGSE